MLGRIVWNKIDEDSLKWEEVFSIINYIHSYIKEMHKHGNLFTYSMEAENGVDPPPALSEMMKKLSLMKDISVETRMIAEHIILNHGVYGS